jgi:hypothetical protein
MANYSVEKTNIQEIFAYYNEIGFVIPYLVDNFRESDNERLRRNIYLCTDFDLGDPVLSNSRMPELSAHNYAYQYPPRIKHDFDDFDLIIGQTVFLDGRKYLDADYQKPYRTLLEPWAKSPLNYSSLVTEAEEATQNFRQNVLPDRIEELRQLEESVNSLVSEVFTLTDRSSLLSQTESQRANTLALIAAKQQEIATLTTEITYKAKHLYDGLTAQAYDLEKASPHDFYDKHFTISFSFDLSAYTGWKTFNVMDINNQGLEAKTNPEANDFALWVKSQIRLDGMIKYAHFPNIGKLYFGVLRKDPQDISTLLNNLREEIFTQWQSYVSQINQANAQTIADAEQQSNSGDSDSPTEGGGEDEGVSVPQQVPSPSEFYSGFNSIYFQKSTFDSAVFVLPIDSMYFQHRMDFCSQVWRFFERDHVSVTSTERFLNRVEYPLDTPFPLYYSVRKIRGFKVGFEIKETVDGIETTKIEWIDPLPSISRRPKSRVWVFEATNLTTNFYQYIRVNLESLLTAETPDDIELNLSLRYPTDFPVIDIAYHHEPIGFPTINVPDPQEALTTYEEKFPKSDHGLYPEEIEDLLPDSNRLSDAQNYLAQKVFKVNVENYTPSDPEY